MDRLNVIELEDYDWMPSFLRDGLTAVLRAGHEMIGSDKIWGPYVQKLLGKSNERNIVDLCSGGGGPAVAIHKRLSQEIPDLKLTLTDLYPNQKAMEGVAANDSVEYLPQSVDAAAPGSDLTGVRTMFASFHHMPPEVAKEILRSAFEDRRPIGIFELTAQHPLAYLLYGFIFPLVSPLHLLQGNADIGQILLSTVFPVIPAIIAFDGFASCLRTYTPDDMRELTKDLQSPDYTWEVQEIRFPILPFSVPLLLGYSNEIREDES